jgi:hypothetical protein
MVKIKVGYLISYDYELLFTSLKQLYNDVDAIYLAIDKNRKTWSGNIFELPASFYERVSFFDVKNKIRFFEEDFYLSNLSPIQCETRERNLLLRKMGKGWLMQLDVDEYIYDFKITADYLKKYWYLTLFPKLTPIMLRGKWVMLYRQLTNGYLYIENNEKFSFITNSPQYEFTRNNNTITNHFTNVNVIHQSWARTEGEIQVKIKNWGHRDDFDTQKYFDFWKNLNSSNYLDYQDIHPISPKIWDKLNYLQSSSTDDFIERYKAKNKQKLDFIDMKIILKALLKKIFK